MATSEDPLAGLEGAGQDQGGRRKVLSQPPGLGDAFDEDILAEIERRLEREDFPADDGGEIADKVELDKADLSLDELSVPELDHPGEPLHEMEVDLAEEGPAVVADLEAAPRAGRSKLLIMAGGALILLLLAGGAAWYFLGPLITPEKPAKPQGEPLRPGEVRGELPAGPAVLRIEIKPFIVPLVKGPEGRLLRLKVSLETTDPDGQTLVDGKSIAVRDAIYRLLRDRPAAELSSARAKKLLQAQIKAELNHLLGKELIRQVYFTEFVITG